MTDSSNLIPTHKNDPSRLKLDCLSEVSESPEFSSNESRSHTVIIQNDKKDKLHLGHLDKKRKAITTVEK